MQFISISRPANLRLSKNDFALARHGAPTEVSLEQQVKWGDQRVRNFYHRNQSTMSEGAKVDVVRGTVDTVGRTVDATIAAAGAVGGAAVNGLLGGIQGVVDGAQSGLSNGSRSTPAAAFTVGAAVGAVGAAGLVEWPVLLPIGATVVGVHYLTHRSDGEPKRASTRRAESRSKARSRSGSRSSTAGTAARSRPARAAQH